MSISKNFDGIDFEMGFILLYAMVSEECCPGQVIVKILVQLLVSGNKSGILEVFLIYIYS